jgi:hypothetical protein
MKLNINHMRAQPLNGSNLANSRDDEREQASVIMPHTEREEAPRSRAASRTRSCWWNMHCTRVCIRLPNSCWERRNKALYIGQASRSDGIRNALGTTIFIALVSEHPFALYRLCWQAPIPSSAATRASTLKLEDAPFAQR